MRTDSSMGQRMRERDRGHSPECHFSLICSGNYFSLHGPPFHSRPVVNLAAFFNATWIWASHSEQLNSATKWLKECLTWSRPLLGTCVAVKKGTLNHIHSGDDGYGWGNVLLHSQTNTVINGFGQIHVSQNSKVVRQMAEIVVQIFWDIQRPFYKCRHGKIRIARTFRVYSSTSVVFFPSSPWSDFNPASSI